MAGIIAILTLGTAIRFKTAKNYFVKNKEKMLIALEISVSTVKNFAPSFKPEFSKQQIEIKNIDTDQNFPEKVEMNDLCKGRLLSKDSINKRLQEHLSTSKIKISKTNSIKFSTILANTPSGPPDMFALYKGEKKSFCGKGNFGKVKLAQNLRTGKWCAVKITRENIYKSDVYKDLRMKTPEQEFQTLKTVGMLKGCAYRIDSKKQNHCFYLFMKYFNGKSLRKIKKDEINCIEFIQIAIGALSSLKTLHEKGYLHRDIKLENIMYNSDSSLPIVKRTTLIDFGSALPVNKKGKVVVKENFGMIGVSNWRQSDGNIHLSQYTDMFLMGTTLKELYINNIYNNYYENKAANIEIKTKIKKIDELLDKICPFDGSISKITAEEALLEFQSILDSDN